MMVTLQQKRNSSIELLRILAMLFIVCSHCVVHGDLPWSGSSIFFNNLLVNWCVLGNLGVDIFWIITGYFFCLKNDINRINRSIRLLTQVWFFSILGLAIYCFTGHHLTRNALIKAVFPTLFSEYWFFTVYFILLLFFPYLNIVINKLTRMHLFSLIVIMLSLWSIIPSLTLQMMGRNELCEFVMFYYIGAYLRKYPDNILAQKAKRNLLALSSFFLFLLFPNRFVFRTSVLLVGCSVGLFAIAVYRKSFYSKWINAIASCTFGVYLFHDHPLMRSIIWKEWLPKIKFFNSYFLVIAIILSIFIVMVIGTIIEWLRKITIQKPFEALANQIIKKIQSYLPFEFK